MAFCATCGSQVEGKFCAKCGAQVGAAPASGPGPIPAGSMPPPPMAQSAPMADNVASALCYALGFITGIIFLVLEPYSKNKVVRFHAFQSIFLSIAAIAIRYILVMIFFWSFSGVFMGLAIVGIFGFACFLLWLYVIISTFQGKKVVLPVIGPLAQQQA